MSPVIVGLLLACIVGLIALAVYSVRQIRRQLPVERAKRLRAVDQAYFIVEDSGNGKRHIGLVAIGTEEDWAKLGRAVSYATDKNVRIIKYPSFILPPDYRLITFGRKLNANKRSDLAREFAPAD